MPKISVIIPAYNIGDFLPRALDSALNQSMEDIEIIVVNDGSKDNTGEVCDRYAAKDPRVKVIHQKNSGAPAARNAAIDIAKGEYIHFMDGDDWAEKDMLSDMYEIALKTRAQMVVAGFYIDTYTSATEYWREKKSIPTAFYKNAGEFRRAIPKFFDSNLLYVPWNKLVLTERIRSEKIYFRNTRWDDLPFNIDYIRDIETVAVTENAYYHFTRARAESETARYFPGMFEKREEEHGWMMDMLRHWGMENDPEIREATCRRYIERIFGCIENFTCAACDLSLKEKLAKIDQMISCDNVRECLKYAKPRSIMMKIMLLPIRIRCKYLTWLLGVTMSFVKRHFVGVFARLKAGR